MIDFGATARARICHDDGRPALFGRQLHGSGSIARSTDRPELGPARSILGKALSALAEREPDSVAVENGRDA
jgi:hypothetical protein